jgi:hypothetical protein
MVQRECTAAWPAGLPPIEGRVMLRVTHYYEVRIGDMDNIRKLIQDVLQASHTAMITRWTTVLTDAWRLKASISMAPMSSIINRHFAKR